MRKQVFASLFFLFLASRTTSAQSAGKENYPAFEMGVHTGWIYGMKAEPDSRYSPLASGKCSLFSLDFYMGFRLGFIWIYPTYSTGYGLRNVKFNNPDGDYIPEGYGVSLPYDQNNPLYYYSADYEYFISEAWVQHRAGGAFLTLMPLRGFELGAGLFRRKLITHLSTPIAYDEYLWSGFTPTTDEYSYQETYFAGYQESRFEKTSWSFPLIMQFKDTWRALQVSTGIVWLPGKNGYIQFRAGSGICF